MLLAGLAATGPVNLAGAVEPTTDRVYLSGRGSDDAVEWEFFCSEGRRSGEWATIPVPSCWELQGFGTYQYGIGYYGKPRSPGIAREQGKYRHAFNVPAEWSGKRVQIVFEGVMTDAAVTVNGASAGPKHQGGFYRFRNDITDLLKYGAENVLEVTVDKESADDSVNLAERRADYWNFGGIFRPVFLEVRPARFIARTAIDAQADGHFRADIFLGNAAAPQTEVVAQIVDAAGQAVGKEFSAGTRAGDDRVTVATRIDGPRHWTAETPALYLVRFMLREKGEVRHIVTERFGFRTFEVRASDGLYLNGRRILLKGVNRHSFWPETGRTLSRERNYADVRLMKELNLNAVRMSHYPPDPEFLDACDELGLYVLDELGGWHGRYDEGVGRKLVAGLVQRDVNHPSIIFWDNGNEGGWNVALDGEFARWDPQQRPVLHPQQTLSGIDTMHYRSYGETQEYLRQPEIFMPTEFLHGLYDGGHGAGLWDYWEMTRNHPRAGGAFLWVFADEGVVRTDQGGRVDNVGNYGADGLVGPHHQREGSFYTVRQIWSPVQITIADLPKDFAGELPVENRYDFTSLDQCSFAWELARFPEPIDPSAATGHEKIASGEMRGPAIAPQSAGGLRLPLPAKWRDANALYLTAKGPDGAALWTWAWNWAPVTPAPAPTAGAKDAVALRESGGNTVVTSGTLEMRFAPATGRLIDVSVAGRAIPFGNGPRFIAARRGDRTLDGSVDPNAPKGVDRVYTEIATAERLLSFAARRDGGDVVVTADYFGALERVEWRIAPGGSVRLAYDYRYDGVVELMGVQFDHPESRVRGIRWLGEGPYRVWQNRIHGTTLDVWQNDYNDPIPGESFIYPEFKGYFQGWRWASFDTEDGRIAIGNESPGSFLGVYTPRDGRDALLYTLPQTGLAVFDVIPAVRNKVNATDLIGPSSQARRVSGVHHGALWLRFLTPGK